MHQGGDILGSATSAEVGIVPQQHRRPPWRYAVRSVPLTRQHQDGGRVYAQPGQRPGVTLAAARVLVSQVRQFPDGMGAVSAHRGRKSLCCRRQPVADHQQPVLPSLNVFLHQYLLIIVLGNPESSRHLF